MADEQKCAEAAYAALVAHDREAGVLCANTFKGQRCALLVDHDGVNHMSSGGSTWPMHLPFVPPSSAVQAMLEEVDRNARAYGWEIGRGRALTEVVDYSPDNPFLDPDWRKRMVD